MCCLVSSDAWWNLQQSEDWPQQCDPLCWCQLQCESSQEEHCQRCMERPPTTWAAYSTSTAAMRVRRTRCIGNVSKTIRVRLCSNEFKQSQAVRPIESMVHTNRTVNRFRRIFGWLSTVSRCVIKGHSLMNVQVATCRRLGHACDACQIDQADAGDHAPANVSPRQLR